MSWQPQPEALHFVLPILNQASSGTSADQHNVYNNLNKFMEMPDYVNYLAYVMNSTDQQDNIRSMAGLLLKSRVDRDYAEISPENLLFVKENVLKGLTDSLKAIREFSGNIVAVLLTVGGLEAWPQSLQALVELMDNPDPAIQESSFSALHKVCEDIAGLLNQETAGQRPLDFLIPKLLSYFSSPNSVIRKYAIQSVNCFVLLKSESLTANIDAYVNGLFSRATDEDSQVRQVVCSAIVMLLEVRPDKLIPQLDSVVEYMLYSTQEADPSVALEACEFWFAFAEQEELKEHLRPYLPKVIPVLLKGMVYSEEDLLAQLGTLDEDEDNSRTDDQDVKPQHYRSKTKGATAPSQGTNNAEGNKPAEPAQVEEEEDDDWDDDFDDDDDDMVGEWTLRKCSAAALDVLATTYGNDLLGILLPHLQAELQNTEDWKHRECGILALGAVAQGCMGAIEPHLPSLVPYLITVLNDPKPLVRSITCWTLGRYSRWVVACAERDEQAKQQYFIPLMQGLLERMLDPHRRVQEAGCSAFATLEEEACGLLTPYLGPILERLSFAFTKFQTKNLLILYDAIGTLADSVGSSLNKPEYIQILMPPLIERWKYLQEDDKDFIPLLQCLASVSTALGEGFKPFAQNVYDRCVALITRTLQEAQISSTDPTVEPPEKDYMIIALDLLSSLTQGLGHDFEALINNNVTPLLPLIAMSMSDPIGEVRQSAFALLGDLAISCFNLIKPHVTQFMPETINQIDPNIHYSHAVNNAVWASGEIALQLGPEMEPYVNPLLERLFAIMGSKDLTPTLSENVAITIGRLGLVCPTVVAPHLPVFLEGWCKALLNVLDNDEKDSSFRGLCAMILSTPHVMSDQRLLMYICDAVVRYQTPSLELKQAITQVLTGLKSMLGNAWTELTNTFPAPARQKLQEEYGV